MTDHDLGVPSAEDAAWAQQEVWSQAAGRLKQRINSARVTALCLSLCAAILGVLAAQVHGVDPWVQKVLAFAAGVTAGLAPLVLRGANVEKVRAWTRARSASEALKSEVYKYLCAGPAEPGDDRAKRLWKQIDRITASVADLELYTLGMDPAADAIPAVHDLDSYIRQRLNAEIAGYYRPRALLYETRATRLRRLGALLGGVGVVLGVAAGSFGVAEFAAWVPVVTTMGTALVAYLTASRYDHQVIEFLRTALQLEHLRDRRVDFEMSEAAFVEACELVISHENHAWMAKWNEPPATTS